MLSRAVLRQLRYGLPLFRKEWDTRHQTDEKMKEVLRDKRTHVLATCMAAYPNTPSKQLAQEFGISHKLIEALAKMYGIRKSRATRSDINRENAKKVKNPFGNRPGRGCNKHAVEKKDGNGNVVATYESIKAAAVANGLSQSIVGARCRGVRRSSINGYYYIYRKEK